MRTALSSTPPCRFIQRTRDYLLACGGDIALDFRCGPGPPQPTMKADISISRKPDIFTLRPHARKSVLTMRRALSYELSEFGLGELKCTHEAGDHCGTLR